MNIKSHPLMKSQFAEIINSYLIAMAFESVEDVWGAMDQIYAEARGLA